MNSQRENKASVLGDDLLQNECGFAPYEVEGFPAFAPRIAEEAESFPPESFARLYEVEARSFWFKARNTLILWALDRFFPDAMSMLEIGCGTGFVLEGVALHRPWMRLWGSELFVQGLSFAADRLQGKALLFQMDARQIPFRNRFDVIGAFDVLEHINEDAEVLSQMRQALTPGGGVLITVPQHMWMWSRVDELSRHRRRYAAQDLRRKLEKAGFACVYATSFVGLLLPLMFLARLRRVENLKQAGEQLDLPGPLNTFMEAVMRLEHRMILAGVRLPWGGSLMMVGRVAA